MSAERDARVDEAIADYLAECDAGRTPDRDAFLARYPDLADSLRDFFTDHDRMRRAADPGATADPDPVTDGETVAFAPGADTMRGEPEKVRYVGDYELLEEIARGGMGVVYRARQASLNRTVALKMILAGQLASARDKARFRAEAEAAAGLDHPNIVPIYEVGEHNGQDYFSMKLVDGGSLSDWLATLPQPPIRDTVALLVMVCRGVHYAHQRGVLHRDLKPANVLVDGNGQPHVTDFGLAKRVESDSGMTVSGSIVGTPSYMPPEQASGAKGLTVAADVYALGAILYECLTHRPPFKADGVLETLRQVRELEPLRPRSIDPAIDRDLETVALKCLEKDAGRRYASAAELGDELQRWLDGEPILARPTTAPERAWKWARRRPAIAGLLVAVAASLVVGSVVSTVFALDAREQAKLANDAAEDARKKAQAEAAAHARAEEALGKEAEAHGNERIARGKEKTAREAAEEARRKEAEALKKEMIAHRDAINAKNSKDKEFVRADGLRLAAESDAARFRDPGLALLLAAEGVKRTPNHLTFNALYAALADCREERTWFSKARHSDDRGWYVYEGDATAARFLPGGMRVVTAAGNSLRVWDTSTGKHVAEWKGFNLPISSIAVSPDGRRAAVASTGGYAPVRHGDGTVFNYTDRVVFVIDLATGREVSRLRGAATANASVQFSPDGSRVLAASWDGTARVWDAATGKMVSECKAGIMSLLAAHFTPDGKRVLTVTSNTSQSNYGYDGSMMFEERKKMPTDPEFDPDARPLGPTARSSAGLSGTGASATLARLWDAESGKAITDFVKAPPGVFTFGHTWYPKAAALSPDGSLVAVGVKGEVTLWTTDTGKVAVHMKGHEGEIAAVAFRPDGKQLATAGADQTTRLWDVGTGREVLRLRGHTSGVGGVRFSPSGKKLVSWGDDGTARIWNSESGAELGTLRGHTGPIRDAEFRADELRLVTAGDTSVRIWNLEPARMPATPLAGHTGKVTAVAYSPDGKFFLTASADQSARLWDSVTGKVVREFGGGRPLGEVRTARFSPDGSRIVTAAANRSATVGEKFVESAVMVWDVATGKQLLALDALPTGASHAVFTPDGTRILTVGDGSLRVQYQSRDPKGDKTVDVGGFKFNMSSSGETDKGTQILWDAKTGKPVATLFKGSSSGFSFTGERATFAFTPDGGHLLTVNKDTREATLYRTSDGKPVLTFRAMSEWGGPVATALSPDGKSSLVIKGGEVAIYDTATGHLRAQLTNFPSSVVDATFSADGKHLAVASYKAAFVFAMPERKLVATLMGHPAEVTTVALSPDGSRVVTGAADDTAAVWETQSGRMLTLCKGHTGKLTSVLFRADGQQVATLADDGTAKLWPVDLGPAVASRTPRSLTDEEAERFEVLVAGRPKKVEWRDRVPQSDPPPGAPEREAFALLPDATSPDRVAARRAELDALRAANPAEVRAKARDLSRRHPGTAESIGAGELLVKSPSPLDTLDAKAIAPAEQSAKLPKGVVAVLGESRQRDGDGVGTVSLSPSEKLVVTSGGEHTTRLWDAVTLDARGTAAGDFRGFDRTRDVLHTFTHSDRTVRTWDVSGPQPKQTREVHVPAAGNVSAVSADGRFAAGYGRAFDDYWVWELIGEKVTGRRIHKATTQYNEYRSAAFAPAAERFALQVGSELLLFDVRDAARPPAVLRKGKPDEDGETFDQRFSPDGTKLAARLRDDLVVWDVSATPPKEIARLARKDQYAVGFQFDADGKALFVHYSDRDGVVWDFAATPPVERGPIARPVGSAGGFARTRDGNRVFAGIGTAVRAFDKTPGGWKESRPLVGHAANVTCVGFAADGRTLYSADGDEVLREWTLDGGRYVEKRSVGGFGRRFNVTPDDRTLVGGYYGFTLWDAAALTRKTKPLDRRTSSPIPQVLSSDGRWLLRGGGKPALTLFDLAGPEPRAHASVAELGGRLRVGSVALSPDAKFVAVAPDQTNRAEAVRMYRVSDAGLHPLGFPHVTGGFVRFSPDGRTLAVATRRAVTLVDLAPTPAPRKPIELGDDGWGGNLSVMFTPDGARLVTVRERKVGVWNAADNAKLGELELTVAPTSVALGPDGRHLAVGNPNGTVFVVRLP